MKSLPWNLFFLLLARLGQMVQGSNPGQSFQRPEFPIARELKVGQR